ncbi:DUF4360 domain-containing protein [Streptomyces sp. NPDC087297]|uniref:DUF4360 domain-containing protein n=1 Tax=Streptomyces sp. NPDC087297 TaxID=3365778 RepID=UPI0038273EC7
MSDNWQNSDVTAVDSLIYAPCGSERILKAGSPDAAATSFMAMDSTDGRVNTLHHFARKRCP